MEDPGTGAAHGGEESRPVHDGAGADGPYDALLLVSFGGPEGPDEVLPFLRNVLSGRNVPEERMAEVAEHYHHFGGISPINGQNRALVAALGAALPAAGLDLPVYWGNRNWRPMLADELARMRDDGVRRALAFVTSAYASSSGCRQYLDDISVARDAVGPDAPVVDKLRLFFNHPLFIGAWVESVRRSLEEARTGGSVPSGSVSSGSVSSGSVSSGSADAPASGGPFVLFTAHSIPEAMAANCDYVAQVTETARLVAAGAGLDEGGWRVVWQSRSGPPSQPWLAPDVVDALAELPEGSTVVLAPIGFVSDHMEVVYDLDTVAAAAGSARAQRVLRAATPGTDPSFVGMICALVAERLDASSPRLAIGRFGPAPDRCAPGCCRAPARPS